MRSFSPPPAREPVFNLPPVVVASLVVLAGVHAVRTLVLSDQADLELMVEFAAIPGRWTVALDPARAAEVIAAANASGPDSALRSALARYVVTDGAHAWTAVSYALLHGSWTHLVLNGVWLAAFGAPVAQRLGAVRFVALALACAIGGALAHALVHPLSVLPMIGASAVVSGMMAAAARFVFAARPGAAGWLGPSHRPLQSLPELLGNRRAALFLGVWFVTNLAFGIFAAPLGAVDAGIAWEAHIGGFAAGLFLLPLLDPPPPVLDGAGTDRA